MGTVRTWEVLAGLAAYIKPDNEKFKEISYINHIINTMEKNMQSSCVEKNVRDKADSEDREKQLEVFLNFVETQQKRINSLEGTRCDFYISDKNKDPLIAEIKIFTYINEERKTWNKSMFVNDLDEIRNQLLFYRRITDSNGHVTIFLPKGIYEVVVSKGSEFEFKSTIVEINESEQVVKLALRQFINLKDINYYAGDLHHHSIYSSPLYGGTDFVVDHVNEVKQSMLAVGLSFGALSDHHNVLNHKEWKETESSDFMPIISKEISTSNGHVLALGVEEDIIYRYPTKEQRNDEYLRGEFIRITDQIKELQGLPQLNHPRDAQEAISFNPEYNDLIPIFETLEIWNGAYPFEYFTPNEKAFQLWLTLLDQGQYVPATTGSDTHDVNCNFILSHVNRVLDFVRDVINSYDTFTNEVKQMADIFFDMVLTAIPSYIRWNRYNCSSGGVRTYLHVPGGKISQEVILNQLRKGHSFLTNGPIIIPSINGKGPGETAYVSMNKLEINITILSNRKLKDLYLWKSSSECEKISLPEKQKNEDGCYDYSGVYITEMCGNGYIIFMVKEDCSCMAVTNPIHVLFERFGN